MIGIVKAAFADPETIDRFAICYVSLVSSFAHQSFTHGNCSRCSLECSDLLQTGLRRPIKSSSIGAFILGREQSNEKSVIGNYSIGPGQLRRG